MSRAADLRRFVAARRMCLLDAAVAVALTVASLDTVHSATNDPPPPEPIPSPEAVYRLHSMVMDHPAQAWWLCSAMLIAGLLIRRRWPLPALTLAGAGAAAHQLDLYGLDLGTQPIELAVPIILFTLASNAPTRRVSGIAAVVVLIAAYGITVLDVAGDPARPVDTAIPDQLTWALGRALRTGIPALMAILVAFALGDSIRSRRAHLRAVEQRAADLEREQRQHVALATASERARITRELHDVVAHSLSVMVAQAQAAVAAQQKFPERTTDAMRDVVTVGRASLAEMRRLLGAFQPYPDGDSAHGSDADKDAGDDGLAPQPGLNALPALVDRVRATGIGVRLDVHGEPAALPAGVDLSAYRIVQEALTNTLKHAGTGAQAVISLTFSPDRLDIDVTDDGAGQRIGEDARHVNGLRGNGLRGIAERVSLLGGHLTVGPAPNRGFLVRARLPIHNEQPSGAR